MHDAQVFLPRGARGASYFAQVTNDWSDWRTDWMPTLEHFPDYKKDGGKATVDNAVLAHRLCNRLDHSLRAGRSHEKDLERIRKAREKAIRRNNVQIRNARDFHSGAFFVFFGFGVAASAFTVGMSLRV